MVVRPAAATVLLLWMDRNSPEKMLPIWQQQQQQQHQQQQRQW
jgi:hypothetical protein